MIDHRTLNNRGNVMFEKKPARVKIKLRQSFIGSPGVEDSFAGERGDTVSVPLADARRMVARGLAEAVEELPKASPAEEAAARQIEHTDAKTPRSALVRLGLAKPYDDLKA